MSDVKIPGVGPVKKPVVLAGAGVVVGILVYAYVKRSKTDAAAAASTDAAATPATPDPSAIDPSTGLTYAEEAAGGGGTGYGYPSYGGYSGGSMYNPSGYDVYGNPLPAPTGLGGGAINTNNDWATEAETVLQSAGVTLPVATAAVTRVLGGLTVTSTQQDYFLQAVGTLGQPPQGYPKPIKVTDPGTGGPPPPGPVAKNIPTAGYAKVTRTTSWSDLAKAYAVFGGSGRALYEYNLLPGKHQPQSYAAVQRSYPTIHGKPSWEVDLPKRGLKVQLPVVGTVTS